MNWTELADYARRLGCTAEENRPLAACTTFKIGGPADLYAVAPNGAAAGALLRRCQEDGIPVLFLGNGSNVLAGDGGFRGLVLRLDGGDASPRRQGNWVVCQYLAGKYLP